MARRHLFGWCAAAYAVGAQQRARLVSPFPRQQLRAELPSGARPAPLIEWNLRGIIGLVLAVGINVVLYYGGRHLVAVAQLVQGGTFEHELRPSYGGYGIGGRHRWFDSAVTPFVGAGVAASSTGFFSAGRDGKGGLGFAPYAEVGAELFRHSTIRGMLALRVDRPLYESSRYTNRRRGAAGQTVWDSEVTRFIPISLTMSIGWGFAGRGPI